MSAIVIDANVFAGYYRYIIGRACDPLTNCPSALFDKLGVEYFGYLDDGFLIQGEWQRQADYEWFEAWLASQLTSGALQYVSPRRDAGVEKQLANRGFPKTGDIKYVWTALGTMQTSDGCILASEDLDFYDPKKKSGSSKTRAAIIRNHRGPVRSYLKKELSLEVLPVVSIP